jgi:hypothetical protein
MNQDHATNFGQGNEKEETDSLAGKVRRIGRIIIWLLIPIVLGGTGWIVSSGGASSLLPAESAMDSSLTNTPLTAERSTDSRPATQERLEVEPVVVRSKGFEPAEITRPQGRFVIAVYNRSGLEKLDLRLDRENGAGRLRESRVERGKLDWHTGVDLPPGRYLLTEANHPEWRCSITIGDR